MDLNDLLRKQGIDPVRVLVFRHRPQERGIREHLSWMAEQRPELFNSYQQTHGEPVENAMRKMCETGYVAAFIGHEPGKALFVGLYAIGQATPVTRDEYWAIETKRELRTMGLEGFTEDDPRSSILWFDLKLKDDFYAVWKGRMVVSWPPPERSWWRRAHKNHIPITAIYEESALVESMPDWDEIVLTWDKLTMLPNSWKAALQQWRGIYYITDVSDGKGYVGSAYGESNLLGRWEHYAATGHGGNRQLRGRDQRNFRFSILQRVSPEMDADEVIKLENSWKKRLHTREYGLNDN